MRNKQAPVPEAGVQAYDTIATEPGGVGEQILRKILNESSDRYPTVDSTDWAPGDEPGVRYAEKTIRVPGGEERTVRLQIGGTQKINGQSLVLTEDPHIDQTFHPIGSHLKINPRSPVLAENSNNPEGRENRIRGIGLEMVAAAVVHGRGWVTRQGTRVPTPWGPKKGTKNGLVHGDREQVLTALGDRLLGPRLDGDGPIRVHIPLCPNRTKDMSGIATTLASSKVSALLELIGDMDAHLPGLEVNFYAFNGETVRDPEYLRLNYPGLWDRPEMPEWCEASYETTRRQLVEPLQASCAATVTLQPMHEAFGDLSDFPRPSEELIRAAHSAYEKFATDCWSKGQMAEVTSSDVRLNQAMFSRLGVGDVVLSSRFHRPIWERAYGSVISAEYSDVGLVLVSRNTLFGMAFE